MSKLAEIPDGLKELVIEYSVRVDFLNGREKIFEFMSAIDHVKKFGVGVNEALISTYDPNKISRYIKSIFKLEDWEYRIIKTQNNITGVNIVVPIDFGRTEDLKEIMYNSFGWYYTNEFNWNSENGDKYTVLSFRPKFSVSKILQEEIKKNPVLWHVTPEARYRKIKKIGFVPKSKNTKFLYPEKIHFLLGSYSFNDAVKCYKTISKFSEYKDSAWYILKVDVRKKDGTFPKFYWDPDYNGAVYTYENIGPDKIEVVDVVKPLKSSQTNIEELKEHYKKLDRVIPNFSDWT